MREKQCLKRSNSSDVFLHRCMSILFSRGVMLNKKVSHFANSFQFPLENLDRVINLKVFAFGIYLILRKRSGVDFDTLFHSSTPKAVLFSALTTMASFGTLAFIDHRGTASIGLLLTIALSAALVCTLVVLPAILAELESREDSSRA